MDANRNKTRFVVVLESVKDLKYLTNLLISNFWTSSLQFKTNFSTKMKFLRAAASIKSVACLLLSVRLILFFKVLNLNN